MTVGVHPAMDEVDYVHYKLIRQNIVTFMGKCGDQYDRDGLMLLDIAPENHEGAAPFFPKATIETLDIDTGAKTTYCADLCENNVAFVPHNHFDVVVCTEVLEHVKQPFHAVDEIRRMLKPDGLALVTVPFDFFIHEPRPDCWRFTEDGLKVLFSEKRGFELLNMDALVNNGRERMPLAYSMVARKK